MAKCRLWLCLILLAVVPWTGAEFSKKNLYDDKDEILLLTNTNFYSAILGKPQAFIIQFYNSWCGHCQAFAETWKKFAFGVKEWKNVISVAVIDCAETENVAICREYDVTAFPTLKLFPPNITKENRGKPFEGKRDVDLIQNSMIDFVSTNAQNPPSSWPDLLTVSYPDMRGLWESTASNLNWVAVIVETSDSYLGREIILSTQYLRPYIRLARAIKGRAPFVDVGKNLTAPYMIVSQRGGKPKTFSDSDQVREPYIQYLEAIARNFTSWKGNNGAPAVDDRELEQTRKSKTHLPNGSNSGITQYSIALGYEPDTVFASDFDNVIRNMFWQEVGLQKNITGDKLSALKTFTSIMAKYLPCSKEAKLFLKDLSAWLDRKSQFINVKEMLNDLQVIKKPSGFNETMRPWIGCRGSQPLYRGYPCGLWVTFHSLTVGAYRQHQNDPNFYHLEVLSAIRQYVINFFGCEECAEHFKNMSSNIENEVPNLQESVLWLWQAHNKVNARLKSHRSEDPHHPKVEFPPDELCESCRLTNTESTQWHLDDVLEFLVEHYSSRIVSLADSDQSLSEVAVTNDKIGGDYANGASASTTRLPNESVKRREIRPQLIGGENIAKDGAGAVADEGNVKLSRFSRWGFLGPFDTSLCIILYLASIGLLILCYCFILTRRRSCLYALKRNKLNFSV